MLTRPEVFSIIDEEREFQDRNYDPDEVVSSGLTRRDRDKEVSVGIAMLTAYIARAQQTWISVKGDNLPALQEVAKIASIAVRIMERAGESDRLKKGLR